MERIAPGAQRVCLPLKIGVYIDQCTDIGRIENVHFNPNFWTRMALKPGFPGGDIKAYLEKNLVGFKIGKTDWEFISNSFVIFPRIGFHFDDFGHGPGNAVITQSGSDICPVAVRVDRTQAHAGGRSSPMGSSCARLRWARRTRARSSSPIVVSGAPLDPGTRPPRRSQFAGAHGVSFHGWDHAGKGDPCIRAAGGPTDRQWL